MPTPPFRTLTLPNEDATAHLAAAISDRLRPGDTLLLSGDIGAGKSAFARALIRHRMGPAEDVPSPTFTLVQTYNAPGVEIWHCDLYRLTDPSEVLELGLDDAFTSAICLVEWPDRLAELAPDNALLLAFEAGETAHHLTLTMPGDWPQRLADMNV